MEKNMIASKGRRIIAVGNEAYDMFEKAPANIVVNSPMAFGMIANLELQEIALYSMMKKIDHFLGIGSDMFFSVPLDMTAVEKRASQRFLADYFSFLCLFSFYYLQEILFIFPAPILFLLIPRNYFF